MGGITSKRESPRQASSRSSDSYSWNHHGYPQSPHPQSPYPQPSQDYMPQQHFAPPPQTYGGGQAPESRRRLERKYSKIDDDYNSLDQVI